ncbi:MAG: HAMP domain-containing sensor histidine kinase [Ruminococcus sp.]|nr:HAMP domain-containing histidine kinase [Ruminococcus sp.]
MIRKLRARIIIINMALMGIVILAIFTTVCVNSYSNAVNDMERGLNQVVGNRDFDRDRATDDNAPPFDKESKVSFKQKPNIHDNEPMQISSYVIVELDDDGNITNTTENNVSIDADDLEECVKLARQSNSISGQIGDYGLMYVKHDFMEVHKIVFASNNMVFANLRNTVLVSVGLFFGSMVIIFLISLWLSGLAVKPVKKAWEQQKQFVADASHELKTPLTVILANNNIMMSHPQSRVTDERQWLESTEEEAQHMKQLIDQMLFLAKSDAGNTQVQLSEVNLSEIVEGSALNFEPVAFEREVLIDTDIRPDILMQGNQLQLNQLAHILIDNAVKYAEDNSTVTIALHKHGDGTEFTVNNKGSVISKEEMEHIFDRFYRAEKSRTTKGYGLGLAIAQRIVEDMNGKITVQSNQTDGTTFTVYFKG